MNSNLLTINNMIFAGTAAPVAPVSNPNITEKNVPLSTAAYDDPSPSNITEPTTADNKASITHNDTVNKPSRDFHQTLRNTTATKTPPQDKDNIKPEKPNSTPQTTTKPDTTQNSLIQISQTLDNSKKGNPSIIKSHTTRELAQSLNNLKADKSSAEASKTAESAETKLPVTTKNTQPALKTILQDTSNSQTELQTVLSKTSGITPAGDTQSKESKNTNNEIQLSNNKILQIKASNNSSNSNKPSPNDLVNNGMKTTLAEGKITPADTPALTNSQDVGASNNKASAKENPIGGFDKKTNTNEEITTTDKSAIPTNQKTTTSITDFSSEQDKSTKLESQNIFIAPEKSTSIAEAPVNSKFTTPQALSGSTQSNRQELSKAGNESSKIPTAQKGLNITEFEVSTTQTKDHNSTTSNNSFNSGFKDIATYNNSQTPITEQSPLATEGTKTTHIPAQSVPNNTPADVNKQISESIQNSLSQQKQDQQIIVNLNPPELGKVFIKFQEQDKQITGLLEVEKAQTRIEIQQSLPEIIRSLQDAGIQIKRLDVALSEREQPGQEAFKDQSLSNGWTQPQDSPNQHTGANNHNTSGINEWLTNNNSYYNISELQETLTTDDSINMLV